MFIGLDWTPVVVAFITLAGVVLQLAVAIWLARLVRTPSKQSIGKQVERTHHVALTNRTLLARIALSLGLKADDPEIRAMLESASSGDGPRD